MIKYVCKRCGYEWIARKENPKECPDCKTRGWNRKSYDLKKEDKIVAGN